MSEKALYEEWSHGLCIFIIKIFYEKNFLKSQQFIKLKAKEKKNQGGCLGHEDFNPQQEKQNKKKLLRQSCFK